MQKLVEILIGILSKILNLWKDLSPFFWSNFNVTNERIYICMLCLFSRLWLFVTLWIVARQVLLSMGFSRREHWSELSFLSTGPGIQPRSPALQADALTSEPPGKWKGWDNFTLVPLKKYLVLGGRWEGGSEWGTRVPPWQIHVGVWQNQYNIVK